MTPRRQRRRGSKKLGVVTTGGSRRDMAGLDRHDGVRPAPAQRDEHWRSMAGTTTATRDRLGVTWDGGVASGRTAFGVVGRRGYAGPRHTGRGVAGEDWSGYDARGRTGTGNTGLDRHRFDRQGSTRQARRGHPWTGRAAPRLDWLRRFGRAASGGARSSLETRGETGGARNEIAGPGLVSSDNTGTEEQAAQRVPRSDLAWRAQGRRDRTGSALARCTPARRDVDRIGMAGNISQAPASMGHATQVGEAGGATRNLATPGRASMGETTTGEAGLIGRDARTKDDASRDVDGRGLQRRSRPDIVGLGPTRLGFAWTSRHAVAARATTTMAEATRAVRGETGRETEGHDNATSRRQGPARQCATGFGSDRCGATAAGAPRHGCEASRQCRTRIEIPLGRRGEDGRDEPFLGVEWRSADRHDLAGGAKPRRGNTWRDVEGRGRAGMAFRDDVSRGFERHGWAGSVCRGSQLQDRTGRGRAGATTQRSDTIGYARTGGLAEDAQGTTTTGIDAHATAGKARLGCEVLIIDRRDTDAQARTSIGEHRQEDPDRDRTWTSSAGLVTTGTASNDIPRFDEPRQAWCDGMDHGESQRCAARHGRLAGLWLCETAIDPATRGRQDEARLDAPRSDGARQDRQARPHSERSGIVGHAMATRRRHAAQWIGQTTNGAAGQGNAGLVRMPLDAHAVATQASLPMDRRRLATLVHGAASTSPGDARFSSRHPVFLLKEAS